MLQQKELPWVKINDLVLASGSIRDPRQLSIEVVRKMDSLIPYDQARIYFIDANGRISDEVLFGADKHWSKAYIEYFSQLENGRYNLTLNRPVKRNGGIHDWASTEHNEFVTEYIKPQGLHYSMGFSLSDVNDAKKCVLAFDRISRSKFTDKELSMMEVVKAHVENLFKNLFVSSQDFHPVPRQELEALLSRRESEIADLLRAGVTPANISKKLCLSVSTVYRHIANIHSKLGVTNRQELIVKLLK